MKINISIHTDGACGNNPGSGGYASLITTKKNEYKVCGGMYTKTTNQRMELMAVLKPLLLLSKHKQSHLYSIKVYSDSKYLVNGINNWICGWGIRGWMTYSKRDKHGKYSKRAVKNRDLWQNIQQTLSLFHDINCVWVKGHADNQKNNKCDRIAKHMEEKAIYEECNFMESELPNKLV